MADYPAHGSANWDAPLRTYIDAQDGQVRDDAAADATAKANAAKAEAKADAAADATSKVTAHEAKTDPHAQYMLKASAPFMGDLNTLVTPGRYYAGTAATNRPNAAGTSFHVEVFTRSSSTMQRATQVSSTQVNRVWVRNTVDSGATWTPWVIDGEKSMTEHTAATDPHPQYIKGTAAYLTSGTDFDTVITPGRYYAASSSYPNIPVAQQGFLTVHRYTTFIAQVFIVATSTAARGQIWSRSGSGDGTSWGPWRSTDVTTHEAASNPHDQYARKAAANTFTSPQTISSNAVDIFTLERPGNAENAKKWTYYIDTAGALHFVPRDDDGGNPGIALSLRRDGSASINGVRHMAGTGSPEGSVAAPVGTRYTDTAATNGAVEWIKAIGTGNTGWRVTFGDTGWRDCLSLIPEALQDTVTRCDLRRVGGLVSLSITVTLQRQYSGAAGTSAFLPVPVGFRYRPSRADFRVALIHSGVTGAQVTTLAGGHQMALYYTGSTTGAPLNIGTHLLTWPADAGAPWPTTLPGVATT